MRGSVTLTSLTSVSLGPCARGLRVVVGAQVGESSLLARAALTVANAGRDIVIAQDGLHGTHLPSIDVGKERPV